MHLKDRIAQLHVRRRREVLAWAELTLNWENGHLEGSAQAAADDLQNPGTGSRDWALLRSRLGRNHFPKSKSG